MQQIKHIIFDLGGVILNIDLKQSELAFAALGIGNFNEYYTLQTATPLFERLETGQISPGQFYEEFRKISNSALTDEAIKNAWNSLLLEFTPERITLIKQLKQRYNIYLLSNTNQIHYEYFTNAYREQIGGEFDSLFTTAYYSFRLGLRKPSIEIYEKLLQEEKLQAAETIFIDDSAVNIEGARLAGLQAIHLQHPKTIMELGL